MKLILVLRWMGRLGSLASLALIAAFAFGGHEPGVPTATEWVGLACFPIGVLAGLLLAWRFEIVGAGLAVASLLLFYLWHVVQSGRLPMGPYFAFFTFPALFYLAATFLQRRLQSSAAGGRV